MPNPETELYGNTQPLPQLFVSALGRRAIIDVKRFIVAPGGLVGIPYPQFVEARTALQPDADEEVIVWVRGGNGNENTATTYVPEIEEQAPPVYPFFDGRLVVDTGRRTVTVDGTVRRPRTKRFDILAFLVSKPGIVRSREELLAVYLSGNDGNPPTKKVIDVSINQIRNILGDNFRDVIACQTGKGYYFDEHFQPPEL